MEPKFPDVVVKLSDRDGNAFSIIARVSKALRKAGASQSEIDMFKFIATSGDYDEVLQTAMEWVEVE